MTPQVPRQAGADPDVLQAAITDIILRHTPGDEDRETPVPGLLFFRRNSLTEPCACMVEPSVVMVSQGAKQLLVGDDAFPYDTERFLINSIDLPASSQVIDASAERPCVGLVLRLNLRVMAELIAEGNVPADAGHGSARGIAPGTLTPRLLEPMLRLLQLLDEPESIPVLAPLIQREIHFRLLMSDQAARLRQIILLGSQSHRVARAIDWLKANFKESLRIEELAARIQMSPSSLHLHFRQLTAMSPLQYQKWLRLNEARRLMLNEHLDAASAAFQVGYESPSQFSREYSRLFGAPPRRDIETLLHRRALPQAERPAVLR
ncbi:AraC family transcriptional regulator N-terminal domain-containing protein [Uliginosibacterium paludis]|uniref:AraC family transcriptional regulator n=1 Tax=Uliginosibacterium paludis TaxID=1615952 RepID=A0ABV2CUZ0_9RHOO